jgi:hypothetical protein
MKKTEQRFNIVCKLFCGLGAMLNFKKTLIILIVLWAH